MKIKNQTIFLILYLIQRTVLASPDFTNFQAHIQKPDGSNLESSSVNFTIKYKNNANNCTFYSESFSNLNMTGSGGDISLKLGSGLKNYPLTAVTLFQIFNNDSSNTMSCSEGGNYTPLNINEIRNVTVEFSYAGSNGLQVISGIEVNSVPYAMYATESDNAKKLAGIAANLYTKFSDFTTCTAGQFLKFDGTNFLCAAPGTAPSAINFTGNLLGDVTGTQGATVVNKIRGTNVSATAPTVNQVLQFNGTDWVPATIAMSGGTVTNVTSSNAYISVATGTTTPSLTLNVGTTAGTVAAGNDSRITNAFSSSTALGGDLSGTLPNPTVNGTALATANTIVKRDGTGSSAFVNLTATNVTATNSTSTNNSATNFSGRNFLFYDSTNTNKITMKAPGSFAADYNLVLPPTAGTSGYVLSTDGAGVTSWVAAGSANAITNLTGDITAAGPGSASATINNLAVTNAKINDVAWSKITSVPTANTTTNGILTSTDWNTFNSKQNALGYTPVNKAGDTMTGVLNMSSNKIINVSNVPFTAANPTGTEDGKTLRWNNTSGQWEWFTAGVAGAGITSINGLTSGSQSFAIGTSGTSPLFSSATSTHTLNIPMASATGVTAGLISKTDYDAFNNKQNALGFTPITNVLPSGNIIVGNGLNVATNVVMSGDATIDNTGSVAVATGATANKIVRLNGTAQLPAVDGSLLTNIFPAQTGNSGKVLSTNGTNTSWVAASSGTVTSVTAGTGLTGGTITSTGTIGLGAELLGLNNLATTGFIKRTAAGTYSTPAIDVSTSDVTGTLPVSNGGTGLTNYTANALLMANGTGTAITNATCASNQILQWNGTSWACIATPVGVAPNNAGTYFVRVATNASITLSGTQTIDGVTVNPGDRVLVKNQNTASQNGVYVVSAGAWTRATDMDTWAKTLGYSAQATEGTNSVGIKYTSLSTVGGTIGTTWFEWNAAGSNPTNYNVINGYQALNKNTTGYYNTANGFYALYLNTTGSDNTAIGSDTIFSNTTGSNNTAIGSETSSNNQIGNKNTAVGTYALLNNIAKSESTAIGYSSMGMADSSNSASTAYNTAVGAYSLQGSGTALNNTGIKNTGIGHSALTGMTSGSNNTALGYNSGAFITTGSNNVVIGSNTGSSIATSSNNIIISDGSGNDRVHVDSTGNVGIGTTTPVSKMNINLSNTDYTNTGGANSHLVMTNPSSTGQNVISSVINGSVVAKWRTDYEGNISSVAGGTTGRHDFYTGGDNGVGLIRMSILSSGNVGIGVIYPAYKLDVAGDVNVTGNFKVNGVNIATGGGTVTSVTAGTGLTGGTITSTGTIGLGTELLGLNNLSTTGFVKRTAAGTYSTPAIDVSTSDVTGTLPVSNGGTGLTNYTANALLMANGTGTAITNATCASNQILQWSGTSWACIATPTGVTPNSVATYLVRVATNAIIALSGTQTIDGVAVIAGDRVLVKNQVMSPSQNGVYVVSAGAWTRATDMDTWEKTLGYSAQATEGTNSVGIKYTSLSTVGGTIGTTSIYWSLVGSSFANNIVNGGSSLYSNTTGFQNTANGLYVLYNNTTGSNNTANGTNVLYSNTTGSNNTANGASALYNNTTGYYNTALGKNSGSAITTGSNNVVIGSNTGSSIATSSNNIIISDGSGNDRVHVDSTGNIGVGTTAPAYKLDVAGDVNVAAASSLRFGGTQVCSSSGCTSVSDIRYKKNISLLDNSLNKILTLNGVQYDWINKEKFGDQHQIGLIAQDLEKVFPEVVLTDKVSGYKSVAYDHLVSPLIEAIKSIYNRILKTENQNREIASTIETLKLQNIEKDQKIKDLELRLENIEKHLKTK